MQKLILFGLCVFIHLQALAQGTIRSDISVSLGSGKLVRPYSDDFGLSFNINGHINYIQGAFLASAGFGGLLLHDKRRAYYGNPSITELFLEVPVGLGAYLNLGSGTHLIAGGELSLLYSPGRASVYYDICPHIDLLWTNKARNENGLFIKLMSNIAGDRVYEPRYLGIGFKALFGAAPKKSGHHKKG